MKISKVTITGLDTIIELKEIVELQHRFPFCEWGILFSSSKEGQHRYPLEFVRDWIIKTDIPLSAHFCGSWARSVMEQQGFDLIDSLHPNFKRVQLNYNFLKSNGWDLAPLLWYAKTHKDRSIILQYNKSNARVLEFIMASHIPENIHFLHDGSGGRGTEIKEILPPFTNYTGYAGGINDKNVGAICSIINEHQDKSEVWIDMESGVRTNDIFDLEKVQSVLTTCATFTQPSSSPTQIEP